MSDPTVRCDNPNCGSEMIDINRVSQIPESTNRQSVDVHATGGTFRVKEDPTEKKVVSASVSPPEESSP